VPPVAIDVEKYLQDASVDVVQFEQAILNLTINARDANARRRNRGDLGAIAPRRLAAREWRSPWLDFIGAGRPQYRDPR
jgi:hypothetical protein